jgi:hypothetical protein
VCFGKRASIPASERCEFAANLAALFTEISTATGAHPYREQRFETLRELGFFNEFSNTELMDMVNVSQWQHLDAAQTCIFATKQISHAVVLSGDAELVRADQVHASIGPGNFFATNGASMDCTLRARNGCVVLVLPDSKSERLSEQTLARFQGSMLQALTVRLSLSGAVASGAPSDRAH